MSHYFFHFSDGKHTFTDAKGLDLPGISAARRYAASQIREMRDHLDSEGWKMIVTTADGKTVFEKNFDLRSD